jgi:NADPH:quinone reductase-like Zn-dependent oxidoreductase
MSTMKALVTKSDKQAAVLSDRPLPKLHPGYVLVKVAAVALNPTDWKHIYALNHPSLLCGCDFAGTVEKTGTGVWQRMKRG